jgi:hypothetical protein
MSGAMSIQGGIGRLAIHRSIIRAIGIGYQLQKILMMLRDSRHGLELAGTSMIETCYVTEKRT